MFRDDFSNIDVVTTATVRPELIDLTYLSFCDRVLSKFKKRRLIINIDPVGNSNYTASDVLAVCDKYFDEVVYRCPEKPSFSAGFKWCWEQCRSDLVLHLEDDWFIKRKVDVSDMLSWFDNDEHISSIQFGKKLHKFTGGDIIGGGRFSPNPCFVRKKFIEEALVFFSLDYDPEEQYTNPPDDRQNALGHWKVKIYGRIDEPDYVVDTGTMWRKHHRLDKWDVDKKQPGGNAVNTTWKRNGMKFWLGVWFDFQYYKFVNSLRAKHAISMFYDGLRSSQK